MVEGVFSQVGTKHPPRLVPEHTKSFFCACAFLGRASIENLDAGKQVKLEIKFTTASFQVFFPIAFQLSRVSALYYSYKIKYHMITCLFIHVLFLYVF